MAKKTFNEKLHDSKNMPMISELKDLYKNFAYDYDEFGERI